MTLYWIIKMLNAVFVISMGATILWLFSHALASERETQKVCRSIRPLFLIIMRDNAPYLKIMLDKKRYLIGRDAACDIILKGIGIHPVAAEVCIKDGRYIFRNLSNENKLTGDSSVTREDGIMKSDMLLANYILRIEAQ